MKVATDYTVGNTAIQIINTGKKIRIIDVVKEQNKKELIRKIATVAFIGTLSFAGCFAVLDYQNSSVVLDKQVYRLRSDIEKLERENLVLSRDIDKKTIDYKKVYAKAKELGMVFPKKKQIKKYSVKKSNVVRVKSSLINK